jgi:hypothetical protein
MFQINVVLIKGAKHCHCNSFPESCDETTYSIFTNKILFIVTDLGALMINQVGVKITELGLGINVLFIFIFIF